MSKENLVYVTCMCGFVGFFCHNYVMHKNVLCFKLYQDMVNIEKCVIYKKLLH